MDRKQFVRKYGVRGHSTTFVVMVHMAVAFWVLSGSADVPDEWWQSLEVAYQKAYNSDEGDWHTSTSIGTAVREFSDGPLFTVEKEIPRELRSPYGGPAVEHIPLRSPIVPSEPALAYGVRPWEWQQPNQLRPFTYPMIFYGIFAGLRSLEDCALTMERQQHHNSSSFSSSSLSLSSSPNGGEDSMGDEGKKEEGSSSTKHSANACNGSPITKAIVSAFIPSLLTFSGAIGWLRTLFYALPRLVAVTIAVLLHKACCAFGGTVIEEILLLLPVAAQRQKRKKSAAEITGATQQSPKKKVPSPSGDMAIWDSDVLALRDAIAPTTADKYNKRVSIFFLTNFMVLYMGPRSLSNSPEALAFALCLAVYGRFRVRTLRSQAAKLRELASLIGSGIGAIGKDAAATTARAFTSASDQADAKAPSELATALQLLTLGGLGCVLRTTMAVPFAFLYGCFVLDCAGVTTLSLHAFDQSGKKGRGNIARVSRVYGGDDEDKASSADSKTKNSLPSHSPLRSFLKRVQSLQLIFFATVAVTVFWLIVVLAVDSWYYCGTAPISGTLAALIANPAAVAKEVFGSIFSKSSAGLSSEWNSGGDADTAAPGAAASHNTQCTFAFTPLNFYTFNFQKGHSSFFGAHPWWWYFVLGAPACIGANIVFFVLWAVLKATGAMRAVERRLAAAADGAAATDAKANTPSDADAAPVATMSMRLVSHSPLLLRAVLTGLGSLAVYSLLGHKEMRFVFPFVSAPAMVLCAVMYEEISNWALHRRALAEADAAEAKATAAEAKSSVAAAVSKKQKKVPKTVIQRLAMACLLANLGGLFVVGKAFKVGPPAVAHYFRSAAFAGELLSLREGNHASSTSEASSLTAPEAITTAVTTSHHPSLHVWAGCYSLPGPSYYHGVFRSVRAVSCNTMAVDDGSSANNKARVLKAAAPQRYPSEHELFLQSPEHFLAHVYAGHIAAAANSSSIVKGGKASTRKSTKKAKEKKKQEADATAEVPSLLSGLLKGLQSKAAQDGADGEWGANASSLAASKPQFEARLAKALKGIAAAGQRINRGTSLREANGAASSASSASLYGGLLGFRHTDASAGAAKVAAEPLPDAIVAFSSLPPSVVATVLEPLGYTRRKRFYHTFAVVDEGSGHYMDVWMRTG